MTEPDLAASPAENLAPTPAASPGLPHWISISGWYGVVAILGAYYLNSFDVIDPNFAYQFLNLTGGLAIALVSFRKHAWQPLALNLIWALIAGAALWKLLV
jgi:hypothetical protein